MDDPRDARRHDRDPRGVAVLATILVLAGASLASPSRASAGTYVMRNCSVPGAPSAVAGPWRATATQTLNAVDACGTGGGLGFTFFGIDHHMPVWSRSTLILERPTDGPQAAISIGEMRLWVATRLASPGNLSARVSTLPIASGTTIIRIDAPGSGVPTIYSLAPSPELADGVGVVVECIEQHLARNAASGMDCYPSHDTPLLLVGSEITLSEAVAPTASLGEPLRDDGPQAGLRSLSYVASDAESGVASVELLLGDAVVATNDLRPRCAHADFAACPVRDEGSLSFDTRAVPHGDHQLRIRVRDAAGNEHVVARETPLHVADPDASSPTSTRGQRRVTAGFAGSSRSTLTVPYGRRITIRGRVVDAANNGVADARVDVLERASGQRAPEVAAGSALTRADGTYSYELAGNSPPREVRVVHTADANTVASTSLTLRVKAAARLHASLRGTAIRFSGRVLTRPLPQAGKLVRLEGRAPGFRWSRFATIRSDRLGRFSGRYRLPVRRPGVRLQIRVDVPAERGYAYLGYRGPPVTLRVR